MELHEFIVLAPALFNNKLPAEQRFSSRYCDSQCHYQQNQCGGVELARAVPQAEQIASRLLRAARCSGKRRRRDHLGPRKRDLSVCRPDLKSWLIREPNLSEQNRCPQAIPSSR